MACLCLTANVSTMHTLLFCEVEFLPIDQFSSNTTLEKATAAIAGQDPIVFTSGCITANSARQPRGQIILRRSFLHRSGISLGRNRMRLERIVVMIRVWKGAVHL